MTTAIPEMCCGLVCQLNYARLVQVIRELRKTVEAVQRPDIVDTGDKSTTAADAELWNQSFPWVFSTRQTSSSAD